MTSKGLGDMFDGDSADTCAEKFPLVSMGGRAEGLACADPGASGIDSHVRHGRHSFDKIYVLKIFGGAKKIG
jgi:hypothetical protein